MVVASGSHGLTEILLDRRYMVVTICAIMNEPVPCRGARMNGALFLAVLGEIHQ